MFGHCGFGMSWSHRTLYSICHYRVPIPYFDNAVKTCFLLSKQWIDLYVIIKLYLQLQVTGSHLLWGTSRLWKEAAQPVAAQCIICGISLLEGFGQQPTYRVQHWCWDHCWTSLCKMNSYVVGNILDAKGALCDLALLLLTFKVQKRNRASCIENESFYILR